MVYHWSLSDNKSQVSGTVLSILADFSKAVVWIFFTLPLIYKSPSPCIKPLLTIRRAPITSGITATFMFHSFFQGPRTYPSFRFLSILVFGQSGHVFFCSFFVVDYYKVWLSGRDLVIRLYLKILEEFVHPYEKQKTKRNKTKKTKQKNKHKNKQA